MAEASERGGPHGPWPHQSLAAMVASLPLLSDHGDLISYRQTGEVFPAITELFFQWGMGSLWAARYLPGSNRGKDPSWMPAGEWVPRGRQEEKAGDCRGGAWPSPMQMEFQHLCLMEKSSKALKPKSKKQSVKMLLIGHERLARWLVDECFENKKY